MKSYNQFCSVARALDVVGDRWAMLVVRELLLGPRRYTDLLEGLPGIGTNVLATRLRELETAGIIERRTLPPPAAVAVYDLTEDGRELRGVVDALARWGARLLTRPTDDDAIEPRWLVALLAANASADGLADGTSFEIRIDEDPLRLDVRGGQLWAHHGAADDPAATLTGTLGGFFRAAKGDAKEAERIRIEGNATAGRRLVRALTACLT